MANSGSTLGTILNRLKGRASSRVHQIDPHIVLWQPGYWDHIVRRDEGLYQALKYILSNPVRAGLVENWWDYPWLGSPLMGDVGPDFFNTTKPEDIVWSDLLSEGP